MSGAIVAANAVAAFARHETFHPRFGWLRKAYEATVADPAVFQSQTATVDLGVGKNMVHAIRYWGQAFKVIEEAPNEDRPRMPLLVPTEFGHQLFGENGWDPYLEESGSLWLLHWKLLTPRVLAPTWWVAFHHFTPRQFPEQQLVDLVAELADAAGWPPVVESSIQKDVDCLVRTYTPRRHGRSGLDDLLDCPFRELGLLEPSAGDDRQWRFVIGEKSSLPDELVAYACLDYATRQGDTASSISVARLATEVGSPGLAFRLPEPALYAALNRVVPIVRELTLAEPGGLRQLLWERPPGELAAELLERFYAPDYAAMAPSA
ncbi:MAG TPA: DUF4007 family protein [Frankiaceae bacterium]|nr:DUF4007 family protein [Frankiaceae bacterium]